MPEKLGHPTIELMNELYLERIREEDAVKDKENKEGSDNEKDGLKDEKDNAERKEK